MTDTTEPAVSLLALTPEEQAEGIAEAVQKAAAEAASLIREFPHLGHDGIGIAARWSQQERSASLGVLVQYKRVDGGVIATKFDDDLQVLGVLRLRLGGGSAH